MYGLCRARERPEREIGMKKTMLTFIAAAAVVVFGAGCNTVHGLGKDIEKGGEAIQRSTK